MNEKLNWHHANTPSFDDQPTECFIEDIMKHAQKGYILLQVKGDEAFVTFVDELNWRAHDNNQLIYIEPNASHDDECFNVLWVNGDFIDYGHVHYKFKLNVGDNILIWWDHDLGDLVVDRVDEKTIMSETFDQADEICDGVYFYWIT